MDAPAPKTAWAGRLEDDALIRGEGRFGDDVIPEGALFAVFVRSPYAHAAITGVDVEAARAVPGVAAVLTGADLADMRAASISAPAPIPGKDGKTLAAPFRAALAGKKVMHVGDPVALVLADNLHAAHDGAEQVMVDYDPIDAITDVRAAMDGQGPELWPEAPGNVAWEWTAPGPGTDTGAIAQAFEAAPHVARIELMNQRIAAAPLEPRAATAHYDAASETYTLRAGTQGVAQVGTPTAAALGVAPEKLRVITDDVGGGFGMKASCYPEYVALLHAARITGRPAHWICGRSESFLIDNQARDQFFRAALALDADGRFLALKVENFANIGAYATLVAGVCATVHIAGCLPAVYDVPLASVETRCYFTNTVPTGPYRGAGRPEANYLMERLIDAAARETGIARDEIRRRNLVRPGAMPHTTPFGNKYDSGDFPAIFEAALKEADYAGFARRRAASEKRGMLRGIGMGCYLEIAGALPEEPARITVADNGGITVSVGSASNGQGHKTVFRRVAAQRLGVDETSVTVEFGDSARDVAGFGAVASRSAFMVGGAIAQAAGEVLARARPLAATLLQADADDLAYADGAFTVAGTGRAVTLGEIAARAGELGAGALASETKLTAAPTFPNGCHVAEVEIDPETGARDIARYTAVDDCGNILDAVIVEGQIHGGVAQGLGQALGEAMVFDADSGQVLSGSLMDYALPRADDMPHIESRHIEIPATTNPLGAKGTGEAGTTAAPCAILNAIADALPEGAGDKLDMPATPQRIWAALNGTG